MEWSSPSTSAQWGDDDDMVPWSIEDFEYPEDDCCKTEDYPLKRRQRRQRLHKLHCYVARTGVVAVAASASMLTRQVENMAEGISQLNYQQDDATGLDGIGASFSTVFTNAKSSLGCTIGSAAARVGELASSLANAIGEPPQRVLAGNREGQEQDAPLLLFWAINLLALCIFASMALFVVSFAYPVGPSDSQPEPEAVDPVPLTLSVKLPSNSTESATAEAERKKFEGILRVLGVVSLSLASGCGLGLRHPLQSALLTGF